MATLTLRAVSLNDRPLTQPITAHFDAAGGTIGRADHNTLALPDPERHISRLQAQILCDGGGFSICNVGSANPILVGGRPLGRGETAALARRAQVLIGGYLLEAVDEDAADPPTLLGRAAPLPEDFDPFAAPPPQPPPKPAAGPGGGGLFDDLIPSTAPVSIDEAFGLPGRTAGDPLAEFMNGPTPAPAARALPDHTPALHAAFTPPRPVAPIPSDTSWLKPTSLESPAPAVPTLPSAPPAAPAELLAAFCEGAGLGPQAAVTLDAELMHTLGGVLRAAVDGSLQLMAARATTKHELRAPVTVIRARGNNPLKFSPDAASAIEQLVKPPLRGFLAGPAAMNDAMHDLLGHTIGTMAGMRAALAGVLARFEPGALEARLSGKSVLDSLLPMNRRARLWDLYLQHFDTIREEADEDFHTLFGKAFLAAYEQQVSRLDARQVDA